MARIAVHHATLLQDLDGIGLLTEINASSYLMNLKAKIVAEFFQIAHLKQLLHFSLEPYDFFFIRACDDRVIDIDSNYQS